MTQSSSSDRRRFVRVSPDREHPIRIDINGENFLDILSANDISEGGVGVSVPHRFKGCDTQSTVTFIIGLPYPEKTLLSVTGQIKHVSGDRFGVCFTRVSDETRSKIKSYISVRLKQESIMDWFKYKVGIAC